MNEETIKISASLDCANYLDLLSDIRKLEEGGVNMLHLDIMDGHFVPNYALGTNLLRKLRPQTSLLFDVHFMTSNPEVSIPIFADLGADIITFHVETTSRLHQMVSSIKNLGKKAGLALNPSTPPDILEYIFPYIDMVLVMTVDPGFVGQKFVPEVVKKVQIIKSLIDSRHLNIDIAVDGGIGEKTVPLLKKAGANVFIAGTSSIFSGKDEIEIAARKFRELCEKTY
ncbi:ribulose-phosphate 3-epimerase [Atribacter laminatus]|uniref:Ribulose-phosphate 3-epimerase n=1 Tax=Atribacter laminatus TaxID=2847778 RepID=A0A7T1F360_ATRLM|nr:ribulose-phosphate 3-epimerase [Atribacter laminatus]QPM68768.1 Ribulose-phosphate 3-epimerase [Atribacter laminatus]